MALKDDVLSNYFNKKKLERSSKYSRYKVFDEPISDKMYKEQTFAKLSNSKKTKAMSFNLLKGLQKSLLVEIYYVCNFEVSSPINISNLAGKLDSPIASIKKSIQRLENKGYLTRIEFKNGRAGWTRYSISEKIFQEIIYLKTN